jgi:hypothetical protein
MPIDIAGRHDGAGVIYSCHGVLTIDDFIQAGDTFLATPKEIKKWRYCIIDLTSMAAMNFDSQEILKVIEQNKRIAAVALPGALLAVASPKDIGFGLARVWEALVEQLGWETMTFRSRAEAGQWIQERAMEKFASEPPAST